MSVIPDKWMVQVCGGQVRWVSSMRIKSKSESKSDGRPELREMSSRGKVNSRVYMRIGGDSEPLFH